MGVTQTAALDNMIQHKVLKGPDTEGIKYSGSKLKLLPFILQLVEKIKPSTVFDGFSGTTRVSQALSKNGYTVIANDLAVWSKVFSSCYLLNSHPANHYQPIIDHLNGLTGKDGWFTESYGGDIIGETAGGVKKPWQKHNTRKLDAIREELEKLNLSEIEKDVVLTSLILALNDVDSTLGHFVSYLNKWSPRSYKEMSLKVPQLIEQSKSNVVHQSDIFELLPKIEADVAYYDPPYGSNNQKMPSSRIRYSAYYHVWTTICLNDKPDLFGKAGRRTDSSDKVSYSVFEDFRKNEDGSFIAVKAIERLLRETRSKNIILSYSTGGRASIEELKKIINSIGKIENVLEIDYRRNVMSEMSWTHQWVGNKEFPNKEFLFWIKK